MKFTANRAELLACVRHVLKAVPAKATVDILTGILIEADSDNCEVVLTGTNYEAAVQRKNAAAIYRGGSAVLNAVLFSEMLRLLKDETVDVDVAQNYLCIIKGGSATYRLSAKPAKDYPKPELPFPENAIKINNIPIIARNTVYAASRNESNPAMTGVRLLIKDGVLRACGCDGMRFMEYMRKLESAYSLETLIPARSLDLLAGLLKDEDTLDFGVVGNCAVFTKENFMFSARLLHGNYINVDAVLGNIKPQYRAVVDTDKLTNAVDAVRACVERTGVLKMSFHGNQITLVHDGEAGHSRVSVDAEVKVEMPGFCFNAEYLYNGLRRLHGNIELCLSSNGIMCVSTDSTRYFQMSTKPPAPKAEKKIKKKAEKAEKAAKAA